jgi:hypothetical protein
MRRIIPYYTAPDPDHGEKSSMHTSKMKRKHYESGFEPTTSE